MGSRSCGCGGGSNGACGGSGGFVAVGFRGEGVVVFHHAGVAGFAVWLFHVSTGGGAEGVEFSGVQTLLGFDERATVVAHWLIASIGVLGGDSVDGGNEDKKEEDESEDGVVDEENDAHYTSHNALARSIRWLVLKGVE